MSKCPNFGEQMSQNHGEQMSDEQMLHNPRTNESKKIQGRITIESENNKIRKISKVSDATYFSDVVFVGTGGCVIFFSSGRNFFDSKRVSTQKGTKGGLQKKKIVPFSRVLTLRPSTPPPPPLSRVMGFSIIFLLKF